jgi:hypothetical protein
MVRSVSPVRLNSGGTLETLHKLLTESLHLYRVHGRSLCTGHVVFVGRGHMKYPIVMFLLLFCDVAYARPPQPTDDASERELTEQPFLREYGMGVQRLPMDGGKIYGWKLNDSVTFGRFKGENDEFGFSFDVDSSQRVEVTTDGVRWRRALGGSR